MVNCYFVSDKVCTLPVEGSILFPLFCKFVFSFLMLSIKNFDLISPAAELSVTFLGVEMVVSRSCTNYSTCLSFIVANVRPFQKITDFFREYYKLYWV